MTKTKKTKEEDEAPHYMEPDEGRSGYWRQFLTCADGKCVIGTGRTSEDAAKDAKETRRKHDAKLRKPVREQLRELVRGDMMCHEDMEKAIKLLAELVLTKKK